MQRYYDTMTIVKLKSPANWHWQQQGYNLQCYNINSCRLYFTSEHFVSQELQAGRLSRTANQIIVLQSRDTLQHPRAL